MSILLRAAWRSGRAFVLPGLLLLGCLSATSAVSKAEIFDISATVSAVAGTTYVAGGLATVSGTVNIDTVGGSVTAGLLHITGFVSGPFDTLYNCATTGACSFVATNPFADYLYLDFAPATFIGYSGGALGSDSYFSDNGPTYLLQGTVTAAPEPSFYVVLAIGMSGLLLAVWRRRRA